MELMELDPVTAASLYKPLRNGEIRLARLQAGEPRSPITINLLHVSLDGLPAFDAISYVWGDTESAVPICCDGLSKSVTPNLHWALERVRHSDHSRLVWADALCINQNDQLERSQQVGLMGKIYSGAQLVLACLGDAPYTRASEVASLVNWISQILARPGGGEQLLESWRREVTPDQDRRWHALAAVMETDWFRRAWVLQEVGLAKEPRVLYGQVEFSYRYLIATVRWIREFAREFALTVGLGALLIHTEWVNWSVLNWAETPAQKSLRLVDLLDHGALLDCRDPRDRIFAFLGHPLAQTIGTLAPDYTKSRLEVFKEATIHLLQDAGVRALSSVEHDENTLSDGFPSWVMRWDVTYIMNNIYIHPSPKFNAYGGLPGNPRIQGDIIYLSGIVVDVVEAVFEISLLPDSRKIFFQKTSTETQQTIFDIIPFLEKRETPFAYAETRVEAFAQTLCCEFEHPDKTAWRSFWSEYCKSQTSKYIRCNVDMAHNFWTKLSCTSNGRAFVLTKNGLYGLAPWIAAPGDLCCVIQGSAVPFVMRPVGNTQGEKTVKLVGEAYIHGIMHGEAVKMCNNGKLREQMFAVI